MTCRSISLGKGVSAIVCGRWPKRQCKQCGNPRVVALCDHPVLRGKKMGTCDAPMCIAHRFPVLDKEDTDYCWEHTAKQV